MGIVDVNRELQRSATAAALVGAAAAAGKLGWDRLHRADDALRREREFRLHADESVGDGLRRIARGRIDSAIEAIEQSLVEGDDGDALAEAVHSARKDVKRLRAEIRLIRPAIGAERARVENHALRDAARLLAGARDREVALALLDELTANHAEELADGDPGRLRAALEVEWRRARKRLSSDAHTLGLFVDALRTERERVAGWDLAARNRDAELAVLAAGFKRIHARARRAFDAAAHDENDEALHEWRKRVKDLRHAAEILQGRSRRPLRPVVKRAKRLGDLLGSDHDLALLGERTRQLRLEALSGVIERRRGELQAEALRLGSKLHKPKPRAIARRV